MPLDRKWIKTQQLGAKAALTEAVLYCLQMIPTARFSTHTLASHPHGGAVARILSAALQAVEPGSATRQFIHRAGDSFWVAGREYSLKKIRRIHLLGLGKASLAMTQAVAACIPDRITRGLLIPKHVPAEPPGQFDLQPGGHPLPNEASLLAGQKAANLVEPLGEEDLLICLISGGGSALMVLPREGVTLQDLRQLTDSLLACGAGVDEINILRRHLDCLKGGGLARLAAPARVVSLILSDVVGDPLEAIASGPTAPDPSTRQDALAVLEKYGLMNSLPPAIPSVLRSAPETCKPGEAWFDRVQNVIVGNNELALQAGLQQAQRQGFHPHSLGSGWQGEVRQVSRQLLASLEEIHPARPFCLVGGGETTVKLRGVGYGGRNQELALASVLDLAGIPDILFVTLATDGEEGNTGAAGAVVTTETLAAAREVGLDPQKYLENNDSHTFFDQLGDLLVTGPSGTNVNDLFFLFGF